MLESRVKIKVLTQRRLNGELVNCFRRPSDAALALQVQNQRIYNCIHCNIPHAGFFFRWEWGVLNFSLDETSLEKMDSVPTSEEE